MTPTSGDAGSRRRVKVVYCGGCNPHIDRAAVAAGLPVDDPDVRPGTTVHLSGCPRACASAPARRGGGGRPERARTHPPADGHPSSSWPASSSTACPRRRGARARRHAQAQGVRGWTGRPTTPASASRPPRPSKCVKSGDRVVFAHACGEPLDLVDALVARAAELRARRDQPHGRHGQGRVLQARVRRRLLPQVAVRRRLARGRRSRTAAATTSRSSSTRSPSCSARATCRRTWCSIQVSPPDKHGFCSFGISVDYTKPAAQVAKTRRRPGQPQHAAHPRRLVHPRLRDRLHRRERAARSSSCSRRGSAPSRRPSASTSPASSTTAPACSSASAASPTRCCSSCTRRTTSASTARCSARASSTSTTRASSPTARKTLQPRQDGRPPSSWARAASTTSSTTTRPSTCSR